MKTISRGFSILICLVFISGLLGISVGEVQAEASTLYVDDDEVCNGNTPCYPHPQDAVNAANPGDTILVYPGTYDSRYIICDIAQPTWCAENDNWAPALVVYKDGLTIKSVEGPENTVIQSTHEFWSNAIAIQHSTNGGITGITGWAPNAVTIVANNVTIEGFTFHRPFNCSAEKDCFKNTAGVFIGSKGAGYPDFLGKANGATVKNNYFSDVWHAVYVWHSSGNTITGNTVAALTTDHWAAISAYDGWDDASSTLFPQSTDLTISNNILANKGISIGAWAPPTWTNSTDSQICSNTVTEVGVAYSHGPVLIGGNSGEFWQSNTDKVLRLKGIAYTGETGVFSLGTETQLAAQLDYDGSSDGSGVDVQFTIDGTVYSATTTAGGSAGITATLPVGVYDVQVKVTICGDVEFTDSQPLVIYDPSGGFVTGGGWFISPAGAYKAEPTVEGKATFGFVSKYKKGASVPDGNTEFQFKAGNLNFSSTSYQWLVVNQNFTNAQFKGTGTINGEGEYGFMLWATDDSPDTFRIKIWNVADENDMVYDNGVNQPIEGGNIVVHK